MLMKNLGGQTKSVKVFSEVAYSIGHFQITVSFFFEASPGAHLFIWKLVSFACEWKLIFIWNDEHQDSQKEAKGNLEMAYFRLFVLISRDDELTIRQDKEFKPFGFPFQTQCSCVP